MSLTALIETGERVYAPDLYNTKQTFSCPFCKNKLLFVNSTLRIKHFRHSIKANCPYGNETKEHEATKNYVFEELKTRFIMQYKQARTMTLKDYVAYIATFYIDSFLMFI